MLRVDPTAFAREREARIERAAELRAARNNNRIAGEEQIVERLPRRHREIAPGWTQHTCKKTGKLYYHHAESRKTTWIRPAEAEPLEESREAPRYFSEAEFEAWLDGLKGKTLTGSQTRRLATLLQCEGALSSLKMSMKKNSELRSQSAQPAQQRQSTSSSRPEWNDDFGNEDEQLPSGWTKHKDRKSGRFFYRNQERKESTWRRPEPEEDSYRRMWRPDEKQEEEQPVRRRRASSAATDARAPERTPFASDGEYGRTELEEENEDDDDVEKESCGQCGRVMTKQALDKMEKVHGLRCCPKCAPTKRRKQFNAAAHRAQAITDNPEDRQLVKKGIATVRRDLKENATTPSSNAKWKAQSDQLRQAMRSMRSSAKKTPQAADRKMSSPSSYQYSQPDPSLVPCPHCGRRFNQQAAERHIPKCQDIKAKPKMLKRGAGTPGPVRPSVLTENGKSRYIY